VTKFLCLLPSQFSLFERTKKKILFFSSTITTPLCLRCAQQQEWSERENIVSNRSCPDFIRNIMEMGSVDGLGELAIIPSLSMLAKGFS
jgi:hypothetical protein